MFSYPVVAAASTCVNTNTCIFIYINIDMYTYAHVEYVFNYMYICTHIYTHMYICTRTHHKYVHIYIYIHIISMCIYIYLCVYMPVFNVYMYIWHGLFAERNGGRGRWRCRLEQGKSERDGVVEVHTYMHVDVCMWDTYACDEERQERTVNICWCTHTHMQPHKRIHTHLKRACRTCVHLLKYTYVHSSCVILSLCWGRVNYTTAAETCVCICVSV